MDMFQRLMIWTVEAAIALLLTIALVADNYQNYVAVRVAIRNGWKIHGRPVVPNGSYWWIAVTELVASILWTVAWVAFVIVGVFGFLPALTEYRSLGQMIAVTFLATAQAWRYVARKRTEAAEDRSDEVAA